MEHLECGMQPLSRDARLRCPIATRLRGYGIAGLRHSYYGSSHGRLILASLRLMDHAALRLVTLFIVRRLSPARAARFQEVKELERVAHLHTRHETLAVGAAGRGS